MILLIQEETQKLRDELKTALDNNDMETLRNKINDLEKAAAFMQQQQANAGAQNAGQQTYTQESNTGSESSNKKDDDVIDADFTDKK